MIDLDIILEASEEKRGTKMWLECGNLSYCDINELILSLRQAEKDAARYRWLRCCDTAESKKFVSESGGWIVGLGVLDGMIDEAMQCNK